MSHSPATGVPDVPGSRRVRWIALGAIALALMMISGLLIYLSPVLALLEPHDPALGRVAGAPVATPPPLDSKQRINILLLGSDDVWAYTSKLTEPVHGAELVAELCSDPMASIEVRSAALLPGSEDGIASLRLELVIPRVRLTFSCPWCSSE